MPAVKEIEKVKDPVDKKVEKRSEEKLVDDKNKSIPKPDLEDNTSVYKGLSRESDGVNFIL